MSKFERARSHAPNDAGILATIGYAQWRLGRIAEARQTMDRVLVLNPRDAKSATDAAALASWSRDFTASRRYMDRALASDPDGAQWGAILTDMLAWEGDSVAARRAAREAITRYGAGEFANQLALENPLFALSMLDSATVRELLAVPRSAFADDSVPYYLFRASAQRVLGNVSLQHVYADSARRVLEPRIRGRETSLLLYRLWTLVRVQALLGQRNALAVADRADSLAVGDALDMTFSRTARAVACALLGDADAAIPELEELLAKPSAVSVEGLRAGPVWAPLRRDPRFQRLIAPR
jgi:tetratricopeptide (TPR) repeat protein